MKIKICGLTRPCDLDFVNEAKPDYIGFVFAEKSRRFVSAKQAEALRKQLDQGISAVGVFVNAPVEEVAAIAAEGIIDAVQLHGSEDTEYVERLRERVTCPIIRAFSVGSENAVETVERALDFPVDFLLLDNGAGGTGTSFDWTAIPRERLAGHPFFLAGGLDPDNAVEAIRRVRPYGIDVSSGVESGGVKDREKILQLVKLARQEGELKLETERLLLRKLEPTDFHAVCRILRDKEVMYAYEHAFSQEEAREWLDRQLKRYETYGDAYGLLAVILKETGELIGQCGITMQDWEGTQVPEVGYLFRKDFWHQGYATEAAIACRDYAFNELGLSEVFSIIRDNNYASQSVARRNGMTVRGRLLKHYYGLNMPHLVFSVRNREE